MFYKNAVIEEGLSSSKIMKCFICGSGSADKLTQAENQKTMSANNLSAIIDKLTCTHVPFGAIYVLPDGRILDLTALALGHEEFFEMTGLTAQTLSVIGWLRANTKVGYAKLPVCPLTAKQMSILEEIKKIVGEGLQIGR